MAKFKCTIDLKTLLEDHWGKEYKDNEQRMLKHKIRKRNLFGNWHPRWLSSEKSCPSQSGGRRCGYVIDGRPPYGYCKVDNDAVLKNKKTVRKPENEYALVENTHPH